MWETVRYNVEDESSLQVKERGNWIPNRYTVQHDYVRKSYFHYIGVPPFLTKNPPYFFESIMSPNIGRFSSVMYLSICQINTLLLQYPPLSVVLLCLVFVVLYGEVWAILLRLFFYLFLFTTVPVPL